jgi:tRNA threonylcarbamoyladenosine biosynthesis protein TsaB
MAFILCIETATEVCSVALFNKNELLVLNEINEGNMHASALTGLIEKTVKEAGLTLNLLNAICVSKGPGSYTGLRVGVSTAKGLCFGLNIPLLAINTLQSMAGVYIHKNPNNIQAICALIDARRMEVYAAIYNNNLEEINPTQAIVVDEHSFSNELNQGQIIFIGNGAAKCKSTITHSNAVFVDDITCSALGLGGLAYQLFLENRFEDMAYFEPFYLKDFVGTVSKK